MSIFLARDPFTLIFVTESRELHLFDTSLCTLHLVLQHIQVISESLQILIQDSTKQQVKMDQLESELATLKQDYESLQKRVTDLKTTTDNQEENHHAETCTGKDNGRVARDTEESKCNETDK